MTTRLVLWDIDGTLLRAGELGAVVFDRAIEAVLGRVPGARVRMGGKTDPQIVREYLELMEVEELAALPTILQRLEHELRAAEHEIAREGRACPGAEKALLRLGEEPDVAQSVLTGNIAPNAVMKLAAFGLERHLDLEAGAYGSDHADRRELVPIAIARQAELRGRTVAPAEVVVIGDTPNDLACAQAVGARCILVATGRFGLGELAALGASAVLPDLTDTDRLVELVLAER